MSRLLNDSALWWSVCLTGAAAVAAAAYILFGPERLRTRRVPRCPGLVNLGNTCFINAILQALASSSSVREWLNQQQQTGPLMKSLRHLLKELNESDEIDVTPTDFLNALMWHGWVIDHQQQDALELYHVVLTTLEEEMAGPSSSLSDVLQLISANEPDPFLRSAAKTRIGSFIAPPRSQSCPLRGLMTSTLVCCSCRHNLPVRYEFIDSLSLPLKGNFYSLNQCLKDYMSSEVVHGVECPSCSKTVGGKCKRTFVKQLRLGRPPEVLCLNIIRSVWIFDGSMSKNTAHIRFPFSLDISNFITSAHGTNTRHKYQLMSVVEHLGGPSSGHYCTYRQCGRQWIYTSDSAVYPVSTSEVSRCEAFLLLYQRTQSDANEE